jgi:hypothetical protein
VLSAAIYRRWILPIPPRYPDKKTGACALKALYLPRKFQPEGMVHGQGKI